MDQDPRMDRAHRGASHTLLVLACDVQERQRSRSICQRHRKSVRQVMVVLWMKDVLAQTISLQWDRWIAAALQMDLVAAASSFFAFFSCFVSHDGDRLSGSRIHYVSRLRRSSEVWLTFSIRFSVRSHYANPSSRALSSPSISTGLIGGLLASVVSAILISYWVIWQNSATV